MAGAGIPKFTSAPANPLTLTDQAALEGLDLSLRDRCAWHLQHRRGDGYIWRTQQGRVGKNSTTRSPVLDEALAFLEELADQVARRYKLAGEAPLFWGRGRKPWDRGGIYKRVIHWYEWAGVRCGPRIAKGIFPTT